MENNRGTGPATSASPAHLANENGEPIRLKLSARPEFFRAAAAESTEHGRVPVAFEPLEDDGAVADIEAMFRLRLAGLRRLPRNQRAAALQAARQWRLSALKALREKRAHDRLARYTAWRLRSLTQRPPGHA